MPSTEIEVSLTEPWHVGPQFIGGIPIYYADDRHFCTVLAPIGERDHKNARLIAAAPEMAAILQNASRIFTTTAILDDAERSAAWREARETCGAEIGALLAKIGGAP